MKRTIGTALCMLIVATAALALIPATRDEIHWQWASQRDAAASYRSYLNNWPEGAHAASAEEQFEACCWADATAAGTVQAFEDYLALHDQGDHAEQARDRIESLDWQQAVDSNRTGDFERYIERHSFGAHQAEARELIESLHWKEATAVNTIQAFDDYIEAHPKGPFVREAIRKKYDLRNDDGPYTSALKTGSASSIKQFLANYPGHRRATDAQRALEEISEGRDIVDLLGERKIEVETQGSGIQSVGVRMRKLVQYPITVRIPVGSYFVSSNPAAQNMVATEEIKTRLAGSNWQNISVDAACANRPRQIPGTGDTFSVQRSPHQQELARLMPVLDRASVPYDVRQAAVWIITDNANYSDLGILRSGFGGFGPRVINEEEAARAMRICEQAGIDIKRKAIWRDRSAILTGLTSADLSNWLNSKK